MTRSKARGHIRLRGDSYEVRVHAGKGRYVTETQPWVGGKRATEKAANERLTRMLGEVDGGKHGGPTDSFAVLAEAWWKHRRRSWSGTTAASYRSYLNERILPFLGDRPVGKITTRELVAWLDDNAGKSQASRSKALGIVRQILRHGKRIGWIARDPSEDIDPPSVPPPTVHAPSPEVVSMALAAIATTNPDMLVFFHLAAATGARRSELLGVQWEDLNGSTLDILRSVGRDEKRKIQVQPYTKSKKRRRVALDRSTLKLLDLHRKHCEDRAEKCGVKFGGYMFAAEPDGKHPWRPERPTQAWSRLRKRLEWEDDVVLHGLRHFHATELLDLGYADADVARRLGHANPAITQRIYAHAKPARDEAMAKAMGKVLR